jgi:hypothetical protein
MCLAIFNNFQTVTIGFKIFSTISKRKWYVSNYFQPFPDENDIILAIFSHFQTETKVSNYFQPVKIWNHTFQPILKPSVEFPPKSIWPTPNDHFQCFKRLKCQINPLSCSPNHCNYFSFYEHSTGPTDRCFGDF